MNFTARPLRPRPFIDFAAQLRSSLVDRQGRLGASRYWLQHREPRVGYIYQFARRLVAGDVDDKASLDQIGVVALNSGLTHESQRRYQE